MFPGCNSADIEFNILWYICWGANIIIAFSEIGFYQIVVLLMHAVMKS